MNPKLPNSDEFVGLRRRASAVIDQHVDRDGRCAVCGCTFPCDLAVVAEHNVAVAR